MRPDFTKIWGADNAPFTTIEASDYAAGWVFRTGAPPRRVNFDYAMNLQDERSVWLSEQVDLLQAGTLDVFALQSLTPSGYKTIPSGDDLIPDLIIQWGGTPNAPTTDVTANFPIAFPTQCLVFSVSCDYTVGSGQISRQAGTPISKTQFTVRTDGGQAGKFIAVGY